MFIINRIVFFFNSIAILALLSTYVAPYISPDLLWPVAFFALAYPVVLLINIVFIIYWLIFFNMKFLFSLAAIIIGWSHVTKFIQINAKKSPERLENSINVITFNARYFGLFDFKGENRSDAEVDLFMDKFNKIDPDIFCIQEMANISVPRTNKLIDNVYSKLKKYNKVNVNITKDGVWLCDNIAMFSKHKIVKNGVVEHDVTSGNYTIYADMIIFEDTIRVIATHLQSIKFEKADYEAINKIETERKPENIIAYKSVVDKMKYAFLMRAKQTDAIEEFIKKTPYKIIVCGDFNDTPLSYAYHSIKGDMKDAFVEAGSGLGRTYVGKMPSFRIDYILGSPTFQFYNYYTKIFEFSDHKLVSCSIKLK
ncbi:MAG: endonuclease/exonuclease/phosphatase family protein [Bacteroidia bacterium]|nr:endonuclease/exonuclease/phosphatase family protein [Bacteroidia bacterium]MCC7533959.1 endonuclease/exonuclease/phosphatase family protein [Bacteroidia bacterium]